MQTFPVHQAPPDEVAAHEVAAHEVVGPSAAYVVLLVVAGALLLLAVLRWREPPSRAVVVRRSRITRVPGRRVLAVLPLVEQVRDWPPDLVELPLQVRAATADGAEVRVLVELVVWVPPPRVGEPYADPLPELDAAARAAVVAAARTRTAAELVEPDAGLPAALGGACLRGATEHVLGVVATVDVAAVELLLSTAGRSGDGRR